MCRAAQEASAPHRKYIDRKKTSFSHLSISVIPYPIGTTIAAQLPTSQGSPHSKCEGNRSSHFRVVSSQSFGFFFWLFFFFMFLHTCKNCYTTQTHTLITLEFGTQKGSPKVNPSIKIWCKSDEWLRIYDQLFV